MADAADPVDEAVGSGVNCCFLFGIICFCLVYIFNFFVMDFLYIIIWVLIFLRFLDVFKYIINVFKRMLVF